MLSFSGDVPPCILLILVCETKTSNCYPSPGYLLPWSLLSCKTHFSLSPNYAPVGNTQQWLQMLSLKTFIPLLYAPHMFSFLKAQPSQMCFHFLYFMRLTCSLFSNQVLKSTCLTSPTIPCKSFLKVSGWSI